MLFQQGRRKKGKQATAAASEDYGMHINELKTDVLQRIFSILDQNERLQTVPLVCKAWNDAASVPSLMWDRVRVTEVTSNVDSKAKQGTVDCARLTPWLRRRACCVHSLFITIASDEPACYDRLLHAALPELHLLQEVRVFAVGELSKHQLALLAELLHSCTSLRELSISFAPEATFVVRDLDPFGRLSSLTALAFDMHGAPKPADRTGSSALLPSAGGFPVGLCGLSHLRELDISLRAFDHPAITLPEEFMALTSLQKLRLDSCGALELPGSLAHLQRLGSISLRQCRLDGIGCLNHLLSMPFLEEVRIEDCTSVEAGVDAPWEDTMRLMPPLLELMDMFNIVCRRSTSHAIDTDLLKAAARLQRMLLARCNQLVALPPVLGTSWQCNPSRLSLRYCGLQNLPKGRYLAGLKVMDLEGNSFRCVPQALADAWQLTHLDLSCNQDLQVGPADVALLGQLPQLQILDLSKVSERLPHDACPPPNEILPFWTDASLQNLAELLCMRCTRGQRNLEVGVLLLGAPWLSSTTVARSSDGAADAAATCTAYVARMREALSPMRKKAAQAAKSARRRQLWRRVVFQLFGVGLGAMFQRLSRRLRWQHNR